MLWLPGPGVDSGHFEPVVPGTGIGALSFGAGTYPVAVGFAVLPAAAIRASVVEVETSPVDVSLGRSGGASGARGRGGRAVRHGVVSCWLLHLLTTLT